MKKNILFTLLFLSVFNTVFAQNSEVLRKQAMQFFDEGKFTESLKTINKIKDKETLENTNIEVWKEHITSILHHNFSERYRVCDKDTLNIGVKVITANIESEGIFNTMTKSYVIAPIYRGITTFYDDKSIFFVAYKGYQQALFDKTGKIVIPFKHQKITTSDGYYTYHNGLSEYINSFDYFVVTDLDKDSKTQEAYGIYDLNGNLVFENQLSVLYQDNLLFAKKDGKWKLINLKNNKILVDSIDSYEKIYPDYTEENGSQDFILQIGNHFSIYRPKTNQFIKDVFDSYVDESQDDNILSRIINDKEHFRESKEIPLKYQKKYLIVKKDNKEGVYNLTQLEYYKEAVYDSISNYGNTFLNGKESNLFFPEPVVEKKAFSKYYIFITKSNNKFGAKLLDGKKLLDNEYDEIISFSSNHYYKDVLFYRIKNKWGFMILNNKKIQKLKYDFVCIDHSKAEYLLIAAYRSKKKSLYKLNGKLYRAPQKGSPKQYVESRVSEDGTELPYSDRLVFKQNNKYGIDDNKGNEIVKADYSYICNLDNDVFLVEKKIDKSGKTRYGLLDKNGKILLPIKYKSVENSLKSDYGIMDKNGNDIYSKMNKNEVQLSDVVEVINEDDSYELYGNNKNVKNLYPFIIMGIDNRWIVQKDSVKTYYYTIFKKELYQNGTFLDSSGKPIYDYPRSLLKIEGDKVTKVLENKDVILPFNKSILIYRDSRMQFGFYSVLNDKHTEPIYQYPSSTAIGKNIIFTKTIEGKDVLLDFNLNIKTLEYPIVSFKNDFIIFNNNGLCGVMNDKLETAPFSYPKIALFSDQQKNRGTVSDYYKICYNLFKFYTSSNSTQYGIINFEGKILVSANKYDEIIFPYYMIDYGNSKMKNDIIQQYVNKIFIGKTKINDTQVNVDIIGPEGKKIASFIVSPNWKFSFNDFTANHHLIVRDGKSIKLLNLNTQKIDLETITQYFRDDATGGYSAWQYSDGDSGLKMQKFSEHYHLIFKDSLSGYNLNPALESFFKTTFFIYKKNNKYGVVDTKENVILPFINDSLFTQDNSIYVAKRGRKFGLLNSKNQVLHEFEYDGIKPLFSKSMPEENKNWFIVTKNNKKGVIRRTSTIIPLEQDEITVFENQRSIIARKNKIHIVYDLYSSHSYKVECDKIDSDGYRLIYIKDGKQGRYSSGGNIIFDEDKPVKLVKPVKEDIKEPENPEKAYQYDDYDSIEDTNFAIVERNEKKGVVSMPNTIIIPLIYDDVRYKKGYFECKQGKKTTLVTPQNKVFYEIMDNDNN